MKGKYLKIIFLVFLILFFLVLFLFFMLPWLSLFNFESECIEIEKNNLINKKNDFMKIGKNKIGSFFFKKTVLLIITFIFSYILISFLNFKDFNSIRIFYNFIFFNTSLNLNGKQIFSIIYLFSFIYFFLCLNFICCFQFLYLKNYWKKHSRDILLRNNPTI